MSTSVGIPLTKDIYPLQNAANALFFPSDPTATKAPRITDNANDNPKISIVRGNACITFGI